MSITPSKLTALSSAITDVTEGHAATVAFAFDNPLPGDATFSVSLRDWEADVAADTVGLFVQKFGGGTWFAVDPGAPFVVPAGATGFNVQTTAFLDAVTEITPERFEVVAVQAEASPYVTDSWNVTGTVRISEDTTNGATTTSITADAPSATVGEGAEAIAGFSLDSPLLLDAVVHVSVDSGASSTDDYRNFRFEYTSPSTSSLVSTVVPADGLVTIPHGVSNFNLVATTVDDIIWPEYNESLVFVVAQTENSANLTDSWYVSTQVNIQDVIFRWMGGAATAVITTVDSSTDVFEGDNARADFVLNAGHGVYAGLATDAVVNVSLIASNVDVSEYTGFEYSLGGGAFSPVPVSGQIIIPAGETEFSLQTAVNTDLLSPELNEALIFAVSQPEDATNLHNSYWVSSTANIRDVGVGVTVPMWPPATEATPASISAAPGNVLTFTENNDAVAGFVLSHALFSDATVNVSLQGWGADAGDDYSGFTYRLIPAVAPLTPEAFTDVPLDGNITIPAGALGFELSTHFNADTVHNELTDSVAFIVAQETDSQNIENSYWVASIVGIDDVIGTASGIILN